MLFVIHSFFDVDFKGIQLVYAQTIQDIAQDRYADSGGIMAISRAEEQILEDLRNFFSQKYATLYVWAPEGLPVASLRIEQFEDGLLLSCLETAPDARGKGYATTLIRHALRDLSRKGHLSVYSHIAHGNYASYHVHEANGFRVIKNSARLLDGTVTTKYDTLKWESTAV